MNFSTVKVDNRDCLFDEKIDFLTTNNSSFIDPPIGN